MKLSIVIPVYNTRDYLAACLDSVLDTEREDYEILIVNDGSTDDSGSIAADYARRYPKLVRVITTENGGLGAARNAGLAEAKGEFVFFLDSDDSLAPGALPALMDSLTPERDMVICDLVSVSPEGTELARMPGCKRSGTVSLETYPELLMEYPSGCNKICRRSLFLDSGIRFPGRVWYEDLRTMPKLYLLTDRIFAVGKPWYRYLTRPGSITRSASLERNLEIIDAVDDLVAYYRERGFYERYKPQLDYVVFYNLFLTASVRVCMADAKNAVLPKLRAALLERVPEPLENEYVRAMPRKHRLLTRLLLRGQYRAVGLLMRVNERRKAG